MGLSGLSVGADWGWADRRGGVEKRDTDRIRRFVIAHSKIPNPWRVFGIWDLGFGIC